MGHLAAAASLLSRAEAAGLRVFLDGDRLRAVGQADADLRAELAEHKAAVVELLERRAGTWPGLPAPHSEEYAALSWEELVRRLAEETAALPPEPEEPQERPPRDPGPWPKETVAVRWDPERGLCSWPLPDPELFREGA